MKKIELLNEQPKKLFKISQLIEKGLIDYDDLADLIPGILHINDRQTLGLHYLSQTGCDILGYSLEELNEIGPEIFKKHQSEYMLNVTYPKFIKEINKNDINQTISFFEDWQHQAGKRPTLYYTTAKILNENQLIAITLSPNEIESLSNKMNNLFGVNKIYEKYFTLYLTLTKREKEILKLLAKELSRKEISQLLFIDEKTVKKHCENIYKKLFTNKRTDIEKIALAFSTL